MSRAPLRGYSFTRFSTLSSGASPARVVGRRSGAMRAASFAFRQQFAQRHARPRRRAHQLAGISVRRRLEDRRRLRRLHHVALFHHHHAVAIGGGKTEVVRDQDGRHAAFARELDDEIHHRLLRGDVEAGGRLVGDQQLRAAGERQRDHHALTHAAGEFERIGVIALARAHDAHLLEHFDRPSRSPPRCRPGRAAAARPRSACRSCGSD